MWSRRLSPGRGYIKLEDTTDTATNNATPSWSSVESTLKELETDNAIVQENKATLKKLKTINASMESANKASATEGSAPAVAKSSSSSFGRKKIKTKDEDNKNINNSNGDDNDRNLIAAIRESCDSNNSTVRRENIVVLQEDIVSRVIGYLSPKEQLQSCTLVSKVWNSIVTNVIGCPITLRIEDLVINEKKKKKRGRNDNDDNNNDETLIRVPLHRIGIIPAWVAARTTKLILVLKFIKENASKYDLNDFVFWNKKQSYFLDRFTILQDLTIFSEFALDQYVSILSTNKNNVNGGGIPTLKRIQYEETNVSNWRITNLKTFVDLAPNLEYLLVRENMHWKWKDDSTFLPADNIKELLPLSKSLRELVLFNRLNIVGNFEEFVIRMPLLKSWDISCSNSTNTSIDDDDRNSTGRDLSTGMGNLPPTYGRKKRQTFDDNSYRGCDLNNHEKHYHKYVKDEAEFIVILQDVLVNWFVGLNDINIHPWSDNIVLMVRYLDSIIYEYFGNRWFIFDEERPVRPYNLPSFENLLLETTGNGDGRCIGQLANEGGGGGGGGKYANYCSAYSRNKIILRNYQRAIKPCIKLYHKEFTYYLRGNGLGYTFNTSQRLYQRYQLWRLVKRVSHVYDHRSRRRKYSNDNSGFNVLVK